MSLFKFSVLLAGSFFVGALFLCQIYATRVVTGQDASANRSREVSSAGPMVEDRLRRLVYRVYQAGLEDKSMADILTRRDIKVQVKVSDAAAASTTPSQPASSPVPAKAPVANPKP